ncbi:MAG: hypothetical protein RL556_764, partial [Actinomycetota bacterium]
MDWQESGAARKLLSDAELEQALQSLDTNAAIALLEAQSRLRSESEQSKSAPSVVAFEEPQQVQSINSEDQVDPNFEAEVSFTKEREPEPVVQQFFAPVEAETLSDEMLEVSSGTEVQAQNSSADIAASLNALYGVPSNHHVHETPALILPNHELPTAAELAASEEISDLLAEVVSPQDLSTTSTAAEAEAQSKRQRAQGRSTWSLIFNWNGSGALLTAAFVGYCFSLVGIGIGSLAIGGLLAFILIGAGYALAALAARRGRSVQQMLARAIFGVTGNMIPAAVLLLTKVIALAVVFLIAAEAATKLIPQIPAALHADFRLFGYLISLPMVLMVAIAIAVISWALTLATGRVLEVLRISLAVVNVLFISALVALGETLGHGDYRAGFAIYDLAQSLTVASALIVVFGLLWSTTAADENLNLRSSTIAPKLIAAGLLNWILVGAAALVAGFIYQRLDASPIYMLPLGVTVVVGSLFALSA